MKTILLTFDIEEFPAKEFNVPIEEKKAYEIGHEGTKKILELLKKHKVQATLFVTYEFAKKYKKTLKEFEKFGCEIACHGYNHDHRYNNMDEKDALNYLTKAKKSLEKLGFKVKGFRAPQMGHPNYEIIKNSGFKYDSSLHPMYLPGYYNNFLKPRKAFSPIKDLKVIPLSVSPLLRLPLAWIFFRNFGLTYEKLITKLNFIDSNFTNIYMHPWEFIDINTIENQKHISKLILRNTGNEFLKMLEEYIIWCKKQNYKFSTIRDYLK